MDTNTVSITLGPRGLFAKYNSEAYVYRAIEVCIVEDKYNATSMRASEQLARAHVALDHVPHVSAA